MTSRAVLAGKDSCRLRPANIFILKKTNALRLDLRPVVEPNNCPPVIVYRDALHQNAEGNGIELPGVLRQAAKLPDEAVRALAAVVLVHDRHLERRVPVLQFLISCVQRSHLLLVLSLIQRDAGISQDRLCQQIGGVGQLPFHAFLLGAEGGGVVYRIAQHDCRADDRIAFITQLAHGAHHDVLNLGIRQMRRFADGAGVLAVALPDDFAVLVVGVPDLGAVPAAAVSAVNHAGKMCTPL